ncbi:MAG: hypothetical protein ABJB85_10770 [Nitrososphaerota archaeon]
MFLASGIYSQEEYDELERALELSHIKPTEILAHSPLGEKVFLLSFKQRLITGTQIEEMKKYGFRLYSIHNDESGYLHLGFIPMRRKKEK